MGKLALALLRSACVLVIDELATSGRQRVNRLNPSSSA
jgi:hypothetical protein